MLLHASDGLSSTLVWGNEERCQYIYVVLLVTLHSKSFKLGAQKATLMLNTSRVGGSSPASTLCVCSLYVLLYMIPPAVQTGICKLPVVCV